MENKKPVNRKKKVKSFTLKPEIIQLLQDKSEELDLPMSWLVQQAIIKYFGENKKK